MCAGARRRRARRRRSAQSARGRREAAGAPRPARGASPGVGPTARPCLRPPLSPRRPGPAMGNVPCAVKHCLSYQQLLREHLWIGDSAAGALEPAQVPSRGPGRPRLSRRPAPPRRGPPAAVLRCEGLAPEKGSHRLPGGTSGPAPRGDPLNSLPWPRAGGLKESVPSLRVPGKGSFL